MSPFDERRFYDFVNKILPQSNFKSFDEISLCLITINTNLLKIKIAAKWGILF